ncbi:hypothetical protein [Flagellimonas lutimaris]|uniref:hypothetical protein n=1 Tax=Flagellimonas lutimaris TaxID=475082 RepID=UPI0039C34376
MKHTIILLVAFSMLVKPLWPIMEYVANYEYISEVLCKNKNKPELQCNGKCYLAQQLEEQQKDSDRNPFGDQRSKTEIQAMDFFQPIPSVDLSLQFQTCITPSGYYYQDLPTSLFVSDIPHPPEQA